jgi:hypothetical protein
VRRIAGHTMCTTLCTRMCTSLHPPIFAGIVELGGPVGQCNWNEHSPWALGPKANLIKRVLRFKRPVPAKRGHVGVWTIERNRPPSSEPFQERDDLMAAIYEVWPLQRSASRDGSPLPAVPWSAEGQSANQSARQRPTKSVTFSRLLRPR